jgi:hypothetical protein
MDTVLIEEVLMSLDDVKEALQQAVTALAALVEAWHPDLGSYLPTALDRELLRPLQSRLAFVERLQQALTITP